MKNSAMPLKQSRKFFMSNPTVKTIRTWYLNGLLGPDGNRVKLEVSRGGGRVYVTHEAIRRFHRELNGEPLEEPDGTQS